MNFQSEKYQAYFVPAILVVLFLTYAILALLSEGSYGGADDVGHYNLSKYAFRFPHFYLNHWGKPLFTLLSSPFAQLGFKGMRIFNVLVGTLAAYFTYRTAILLKFRFPVLAIFLIFSSPLYTVLMMTGMTEILASLVLVLSIYLFFKQKYSWSALILSFIPFARTEAILILPLFFIALIWLKRWKSIPFLAFGFIVYSVVGAFYYQDILWVIHKMPYTGNAKEIYGSGKLLHYVEASKYIFGLALSMLMGMGLLLWFLDPFLKYSKSRKDWLIQMLVVYMPFIAYLAAHSYVWWRGVGNSVGMIRVIVAVLPSAVLLGLYAWSSLMEWIPVSKLFKQALTVIFCLFLLTIPYQIYDIPVPHQREEKLVKESTDWLRNSVYAENRFYYFDPFVPHFLKLNPYDHARSQLFVPNREHPEESVEEGELVIWDAHFGPNEGQFALSNLIGNPDFKLIHLCRGKESFTTLGGYEYEILIFLRIAEDEDVDNQDIYESLLAEIQNEK